MGWISLVVGVVVLLFILFRIKKKKKPRIILRETFEMSDEETLLFDEINAYREENQLPTLVFNGYMKTLADDRTLYWKIGNIKKTLHFEFFGERQPYLDIGFEKIAENTNFGITNNLNGFKKSDSHNKTMLMDWRFMAVSLRDRWCCVIFSK